MAPIPLKSVVSVSSEDPLNPATNLLVLNSSAGKKWLCCQDNKTRKSEVVLELAKRSKITAIEIGNFGSAFVEVLVNNTDSPTDNYITLLPSSMLMSIADSRAGRSKTNYVRYEKEKLSLAAVSKKWNLVKIQCCQKYNNTEQFGLQRVSFLNDLPVSQTPIRPSTTSQLLSPSALTPTVPSKSKSTPHRIPYLPSSRRSSASGTRNSTEHDHKSKSVTPKRPLREQTLNSDGDHGEDYEFAGIEVQSRLFKNCVHGKPSTANSKIDDKEEQNVILNRKITDKDKYVDKLKGNSTCSYQRTKLLKKELPKAEGLADFAETFKHEESKKGPGANGALSRLSAFDNDYEIGQEPEFSWSRKRHKAPGSKRSAKKVSRLSKNGWLTNRKQMEDMIAEIEAVRDRCTSDEMPSIATVTTDTYNTLTLQDIQADTEKKLTNKDDNDSDETRSYSYDGDNKQTSEPGYIECPLCGVLQPAYAIELHASSCGEEPLAASRSCFEPICID